MLPENQREVWELLSPDRTKVAFVRDHDLWVRTVADGTESRLTQDGSAERPYAMAPDVGQRRPMLSLLGRVAAPAAVWSPDSQRLITQRLDQRDVRIATLIESAPADGGPPRSDHYHYPLPGDERLPMAQFTSIHVATGTQTVARMDPVIQRYLAATQRGEVRWVDDRRVVFYVRDRFYRSVSLVEFDVITGDVRTIVTEGDDQRVDTNPWSADEPIAVVLPRRRLVLWWSQRSGWGHLYRCEMDSSAPQVALTQGEFLVRRVLHVDEDERHALVLVTGLADDPYLHQLLRLDIDTGEVEVLVSDAFDHAFTVSPTGHHVIDRQSLVDTAPISIVRDLRCAGLAAYDPARTKENIERSEALWDRFGVLHVPRRRNGGEAG